jgi:predicted  nucleic acid-binding Zn-ribbon protein
MPGISSKTLAWRAAFRYTSDDRVVITKFNAAIQASQEERNHLRKQLERMQEKQQADANLKARVATQQEELVEMRKKFERSRGDLKQRTVDVHMLQVCHRSGLSGRVLRW